MYPWLVPYYQQIAQTFAQGHGHHALLFKCEQGLGAQKLLQKITALLLCQNSQSVAQGEPCAQCHSCHLETVGCFEQHVIQVDPWSWLNTK